MFSYVLTLALNSSVLKGLFSMWGLSVLSFLVSIFFLSFSVMNAMYTWEVYVAIVVLFKSMDV